MNQITKHIFQLAVVACSLELSGCGGGSSNTTESSSGNNLHTVETSFNEGGRLSPSQSSVTEGLPVEFDILPEEHFQLASVSGCGGALNGGTYEIASVRADCIVTAEFEHVRYTLSTSTTEGGTVSVSNIEVDSLSTYDIEIFPEPGYGILSVSGCMGELTEHVYSVPSIVSDCNVDVEFIEIPTLSFTFPNNGAIALDTRIRVRGEAAGANGISSIVVNGVDAELTVIEEGQVSWLADIPVPVFVSEFDIAVKLTDSNGHEIESETKRTIRTGFFDEPGRLALDEKNGRLLSASSIGQLLALDLDSGDLSSLFLTRDDDVDSTLNNRKGGMVIPSSDTYLTYTYETGFLEGPPYIQLISVDLNTQHVKNLDLFNFPEEKDQPRTVEISDYFYDEKSHSAYFLFHFRYSISWKNNHSKILRYDLGAGEFDVAFGGTLSDGALLKSQSFSMADEQIVIYENGFPREKGGIYRLNLLTKSLEHVSESIIDYWGRMKVDKQGRYAYIASSNALHRTSLDDGSTVEVSDGEEGDLYLSSSLSMVLDETNNQMIVGHLAEKNIVAIDLETGGLKTIWEDKVGDGMKITDHAGLVFDAERQRILTVARTGLGRLGVFEVDLKTGNRNRLAKLDQGASFGAHSVLFDQEANSLLVVFADEIQHVDLSNGKSSVIVSQFEIEGTQYSDIKAAVLDQPNNQIILIDKRENSVLSVDAKTLEQSVLASGEELNIPGIERLALSTRENMVYVASISSSAIYGVDLDTQKVSKTIEACTTKDDTLLTLAFNSWNEYFFLDDGQKTIYFEHTQGIQSGTMALNVDDATCELKEGNFPYVRDATPMGDEDIVFSVSNYIGVYNETLDASTVISM